MSARAVYKDEPITVAVAGGFVRRPAPESGIVIEFEETVAFIGWAEIERLRARVMKPVRK